MTLPAEVILSWRWAMTADVADMSYLESRDAAYTLCTCASTTPCEKKESADLSSNI
jgi:hypothetical protein